MSTRFQIAAEISLFTLASVMLRDYAALLREREAAKAWVTDERLHELVHGVIAPNHSQLTEDGDGYYFSCDALEAFTWDVIKVVAPMLASARVPDNCVLIAVERPDGYEDVHPDLVAEDFAGDALERGWAYQVIAAAPNPETEE